MKKIICVVISIVMMLSLCAPAFAIDIAEAERMRALEAVAYLDLNEVDDSMKAEILAAREEIIFSKSWVVEGRAEVVDKDGNVIRELPNFKELFPEDWAVPVSVNHGQTVAVERQNAVRLVDPYELYTTNIFLREPSSTQSTAPFFTTNSYYSTTYGYTYLYDYISTYGYHGFPSNSGTFNVGYTNMGTGASLSYAKSVPCGSSVKYYPVSYISVGIRASSYDCYNVQWTLSVSGYYT